MNQEIRWEQRFGNFKKALSQLNKFIQKGELNELEEQGLIKAFEYTYELAWKTLQDFLRDKGYSEIAGPKPVIEQAFQDGYIDGFAWVRMHKSRNLTNLAYEREIVTQLKRHILSEHVQSFESLISRLEKESYSDNKPSLV
ncbi:nucleotidyltransferase substrate binding protein [Larkinella knui]|uniref:Nucleotidyltransferase n=1 Tax=Larkinella knui TaxID=2025310 RepID=A0A3P1CNZ5_9BACT|nr:HI0074 family nucleotidyltransferase substrate-binding subunit [Larkinella knui]RRB14786.1 nucleotidyltransferase [Larkinella knui]